MTQFLSETNYVRTDERPSALLAAVDLQYFKRRKMTHFMNLVEARTSHKPEIREALENMMQEPVIQGLGPQTVDEEIHKLFTHDSEVLTSWHGLIQPLFVHQHQQLPGYDPMPEDLGRQRRTHSYDFLLRLRRRFLEAEDTLDHHYEFLDMLRHWRVGAMDTIEMRRRSFILLGAFRDMLLELNDWVPLHLLRVIPHPTTHQRLGSTTSSRVDPPPYHSPYPPIEAESSEGVIKAESSEGNIKAESSDRVIKAESSEETW